MIKQRSRPSVCHWDSRDANDLLHYIDIATPMLKDGKVIGKYINSDDLHMNAAGYDLWAEIVQREMVFNEAGQN